jgi:hypothetical protein
MADKRLTQSPQAIRGTSQDFEKFGNRDIRLGMNDPDQTAPENEGAFKVSGLATSQDDLTGASCRRARASEQGVYVEAAPAWDTRFGLAPNSGESECLHALLLGLGTPPLPFTRQHNGGFTDVRSDDPAS